jgi:hypothetical protein
MYKWPYSGWASAGMDAWVLGMEASTVIGLRMAKVAAGTAASDEVQRMVSEKVQAAMELQWALATGALGTDPVAGTRRALRHYSRKVKANRKRLG